ncbi:hypothetical protein [Roseomonas sp. USHLN139]|uniref:hypothetical protein n=1 Tax=Roseomonas sp. USHLN139 TaxID=3081298 RepID=UPI003B013FBB
MPLTRRRAAAAAALALLLPACASSLPDLVEVPQPVADAAAGRVILFTGLNWFGESYRGTGTDALAQRIRAAGVPASIYTPGAWEKAAEAVLQLTPRPAALAVYGYSAGGSAAVRFARRLGEAGIAIETLVLLEAWNAAEIPCTVRLAVQYRLEPGNAMTAARPGCTRLVEALIDDRQAGRASPLGHLTVAVEAEVLDLLASQLLQDGQVRRR